MAGILIFGLKVVPLSRYRYPKIEQGHHQQSMMVDDKDRMTIRMMDCDDADVNAGKIIMTMITGKG